MLPTFVIGLREGLEAALIVGIIAAFLVQEGRRDAMRWVWLGVAVGVAICLVVGIGLRIASEQLPQRQQEQLETVIALFAVGMVSWMILWMRKHAAGLSGELRDRTRDALATGSTAALITMAFLAVLREGLETAVFLVAVFQDSDNPRAAGGGAVLGIVLACVLGYLIYRGGVRINMARFFKFTGLVLVIVAAGLLSTAVHTAHEGGWWHLLLGQAVDLSAVVKPGTVQYALITGMLGIQAKPTYGEVIVWLLYAVPMTIFVLRPPKPRGTASGAPKRSRSTLPARAAATTIVVLLVIIAGTQIAGAKSNSIEIRLTDAGCPKRLEASAGDTTFTVKNVDASKITEFEVLQGHRVVGEKENLTPGLSGSFSVKLEPGKYVTYCPDGDRERGALIVAGTDTVAKASSAAATSVATKLTEYHVTVKPTSAGAGNVSFKVKNAGSINHEFVVVRAANPNLPTDADGAVDEDQIPVTDKIGELEDLEPGSTNTFKAGELSPGTYQLFCNVVDQDKAGTVSHYAQGMHTTFTVQ